MEAVPPAYHCGYQQLMSTALLSIKKVVPKKMLGQIKTSRQELRTAAAHHPTLTSSSQHIYHENTFKQAVHAHRIEYTD
jgi:hypothetical protein